MDIKSLIRDIPDFPQEGIIFRDITTLMKNSQGLNYVIDALVSKSKKLNEMPEYIVGIESRGFIFAPALAYHLNAGFIPVRKKGKLPALVHSIQYDLEYGQDTLEIHQDAVKEGSKVMVVDDVIATGGTAKATMDLLNKIGCDIVAFGFVIELLALNGRDNLPSDIPILAIAQYD